VLAISSCTVLYLHFGFQQADELILVMTPENMATTKMASAFIQMVSKFRDASTEEVASTLEANLTIL
jgi:hypothetical protein